MNSVTKKSHHATSKTASTDLKTRPSPLCMAVRTALISAAAVATPAMAQTLEEVLVTATKRTESIQDVPLAITAFSGSFTKNVNLNDVKDLVSFTPGVTGNSQDSFIDAISIRGIRTQDFGVGGDPSAAFFKNDLYEGRNGSAVTSLYDMERSEILRGPQGFLFGRNSIGGAFSVHTKKAQIGQDKNSGYVDLDLAERGHVGGEGAVNFGVNENFAIRVAGYFSKEDGFVNNIARNEEEIEHDKSAIRLSAAYARDALSIDGTIEFESREQSGSVYRAIERGDIWDTFVAALGPVDVRGSDYEIDSDQSLGDNDNADILTLGANIEYDIGALTLTSNTGYKDHDYFYTEDYDGTPLDLNNYQQDQKGDYFQQDLRLTSNNDGPFSWYAGVSYYKEEIDTLFTFSGEEDFFCQYYGYYYNGGQTFTGCADLYAYYGSPFASSPDGLLTETGRIIGDYSGWSTYLDMNFAVNDQFDVGLGIRYTDDTKDFTLNVPNPVSDLGPYWAYTFSTDGNINGKKSWDDVQTRLILRYTPNDDHMLFGSYTEGFKSGGFGSFALVDADGNGVGAEADVTQAGGYRPNAFAPESVDSIEFGYKGKLWGGRANLDLTYFTYDYEDLQVVVFNGGASAVENVGKVDASGLEGSITAAISDNWNLYLAASYLDSEAVNLQSICGLENADGCEGSSLFWAPEYAGALAVTGTIPRAGGEYRGSFELFWESERGGGWEGLQSTMIDSYAEAAVRFGYTSSTNWDFSVYIENLADEETWDGLNNNGGVLPSHFFGPKRPRTIGITVGYQWN